MGLSAATGVGVGAIVGGGILALAGVAFAATGPAAILAFALNGIIALLTALSFAEMASKFPESGGTYTFAKKVLSVEAAFTVGWVVWFASIVAAVLYAVGFGHFALIMIADIWNAARGDAPAWLHDPRGATVLAAATTLLLGAGLMRKAAGGGQWTNVAKVIVFSVLIAGGLYAVAQQPPRDTLAALRPFFTVGLGGLIQAMGYTFIALQGFDLIAAVGGEVRDPEKTLPRAMLISLAIALVIYLPLLFVIATVGVLPGESIGEAAANDPEGIVAVAARIYLGPFGYWLVILAAVLSMFSALQANLLAASRIARAMALDRTLPSRLAGLNAARGTPIVAVAATTVLVLALLFLLPDVAAAGAASSLIFLVTFGLAHWIAILVRQRSIRRPPPFRTPLFPLVPVIGGLSCIALAIFQGIAVPSAGIVALIWLSIGGVLFLGTFARQARLKDASSTAYDPELVTLRGRTPLVLVPIANPQHAAAMIALADALVPGDIGRVMLQTVVSAPEDWRPDDDPLPIERAQAVLRELIAASVRSGVHAEALMTVAPRPLEEIARVARLHRCQSVVLGLSEIPKGDQATQFEELLGALECDVVVLRQPPGWKLDDAAEILVPVAGRGGHDHLLALLIGSLLRGGRRRATLLRVLPATASASDIRRAERELHPFTAGDLESRSTIEVVPSEDPLSTIANRADRADLLVLGVQRLGRRKKLFGAFTQQLVQRTARPIIIVSRRG